MSKAFASAADLEEKQVTFSELSPGLAYAYTAEGDPNTGVIVTDRGCIVIDAQATPRMAQQVMDQIETVTEKPVTHVILTHYHAVRVLGTSGYSAFDVIASEDTRDLIVERGEQDWASELGRFPRLFQGAESIPGLTWPTQTFKGQMSLWFDDLEVRLMQLGRGHTKGDTVVWLPEQKILFSGDLVEYGATPYTGDAYHADWPATLDNLAALGAEKLVPGRGEALQTREQCEDGIAGTRAFIADLYGSVKAGVEAGKGLKEVYDETFKALEPKYGHWVIFEHCMPFDVTRAYQEASGARDPQIWTAERDREMWTELAG